MEYDTDLKTYRYMQQADESQNIILIEKSHTTEYMLCDFI